MTKGGKPFYDRQKAGELRTRLLEDCIKILDNDPEVEEWSDLKKNLILKTSNNLLPRLQEVTGEDGAPLQISFDSAFKVANETS